MLDEELQPLEDEEQLREEPSPLEVELPLPDVDFSAEELLMLDEELSVSVSDMLLHTGASF